MIKHNISLLGRLLCWLWIHNYQDSGQCGGWYSCTRCGTMEWRI